jgi:hypothetical protein
MYTLSSQLSKMSCYSWYKRDANEIWLVDNLVLSPFCDVSTQTLSESRNIRINIRTNSTSISMLWIVIWRKRSHLTTRNRNDIILVPGIWEGTGDPEACRRAGLRKRHSGIDRAQHKWVKVHVASPLSGGNEIIRGKFRRFHKDYYI